MAWASFPRAILPDGITTIELMPARCAYAAAEAEVFPVEAHATARAPSSTAFETASVIPRSLNDPVGFRPSNFRYTGRSTDFDKCGAGMSGVSPSRSVTTGVSGPTGSRSR